MNSDDGGPADWVSRVVERPDERRKLKRLALGFLLLVVGLFGLTSLFYTVEAEGKAVVKRFGRVIDVVEPGLHFKLPFGIDTATFVPTERVLKEEFGFRTVTAGRRSEYRSDDTMLAESLMLTGDLAVIDVHWVVQYRISDPAKFLHRVRQRTATIRDISEAVMRRIVGNRLASDVLTVGRVSVADSSKRSMQAIFDDYDMGVRVAAVEMQDVTPPEPVKPAFNEVNEARQERERSINEAEKLRNTVIPKAKGEAKQVVAEAQAYRARRVNGAKGEAARFSSILAAYRQAPQVTRTRMYLEAIDAVLPSMTKYVSEPEAGATRPLPLLQLGAAAGGAK